MTAAQHDEAGRPGRQARSPFRGDPVGDQIPAPHQRKRLPAPLLRKYLAYDVEVVTALLYRAGFSVIDLGFTRRGREAALAVMSCPDSLRFGLATLWLHHDGRVEWDTATASYRLPAGTTPAQAVPQILATLRPRLYEPDTAR